MPFHPPQPAPKGWKTVQNEVLYANPYVELCAVREQTPSRPEGVEWTVLHRRSACVIAPMTADGRFLLVRQERVPVRSLLWEFPAGQVDETDLTPEILEATALRELAEETGHRLGSGGGLTPLGYFYPSAGFTDECSHLFLAHPVEPNGEGARPDASEAFVDCQPFSVEELTEMIARGIIVDANTLATFSRLVARGAIALPHSSTLT